MDNNIENFSLNTFLQKTIALYATIIPFVFNSIKKYWYLPIILSLFISAAFFIKIKNVQTVYSASSSYTYVYLNKKVYGDLLLDIELLVNNSDFVAIATKLHISEADAVSIVSFKAVNIVGSPLYEDFSELHVPFYINVVTTDKQSFSKIEAGILKYLINDHFVFNYIKDKQSFNTERLQFIQKEIVIIDTLISKIDIKNIDKLEGLFNISRKKLNEKIAILKEIDNKKALKLLKPFTATQQTKSSIIKSVAYKYFALFFILSILFTTYINWYKNIKDDF